MPRFPWLRFLAGLYGGAGALSLIVLGEIAAGVGLLGAMLGFFIGEANGKRPSSGS